MSANDFENNVQVIEYDSSGGMPYSVTVARWFKRIAMVPSGVGLSILALFTVTGLMPLVICGAVWLYLGGAITFVVGVTSLVLFFLTGQQKERDADAHHEYQRALQLCFLAVLVAIACFVLRAIAMDWWNPSLEN